MAASLRGESEGAKQGKSMELMDVSVQAVEDALRDTGCDLLIHGHTHRPMRHVHDVDGRERVRHVLSDWYEGRGGYLEVTPQSQRFIAIT